MGKSYTGHSFDFQEADAGALDVTHAELTKKEIKLEWVEDGEAGYLTATSDDGVLYRGNFGYPRPEPFYTAEFRLYRAANGDVLLFGRWRWTSGENGLWLFRLTPTEG
jgi:hypothetical protein